MTAESRRRLWTRVACAYAAAVAGATLFVLVAIGYLDASGPEGLAGVAAAAAGAAVAPLWLDLRQGVSPRDAVDRMTCGLAGACAVFLAAAVIRPHRRDMLPLLAIAAFPSVVACVGGMRRPGGRSWLVGVAAWLCGGIALGSLLFATLITSGRPVRLWGSALVIVLCLLPIDVSFQRGGVRGRGFLPARGGDYIADAMLNPPRYGFVFVPEGLYYSPRWIWVW